MFGREKKEKIALAFSDRLIFEEKRELVRLRYQGEGENAAWGDYQPEILGISIEEWEKACRDPRDISWDVRVEGFQHDTPFRRYRVKLKAKENRISLHCAAADLFIFEGERELVRLLYVGTGENALWRDYQVEFVGITAEEMETAYWKDPRDVPWVFRGDDLERDIPYCRYMVTWVAKENRVSLKYSDSYLTSPPGLAGEKRESVPQERAPLSWEPLDMPAILEMLKSSDRTKILIAISTIKNQCARSQAPWASEVFLKHAIDLESKKWNSSALCGFGELARVHGYVDRERVLPILNNALTDSLPGVRRAAQKSLDEIARFCGL